MQDYMDRTTLIAPETGTVFVEIVMVVSHLLTIYLLERAMQRLSLDTKQSRAPE